MVKERMKAHSLPVTPILESLKRREGRWTLSKALARSKKATGSDGGLPGGALKRASAPVALNKWACSRERLSSVHLLDLNPN
jgi:hypothetical protein